MTNIGLLLLGIGNGGNAYGQLVGVPSGTTALLIALVAAVQPLHRLVHAIIMILV